jgi:HTH-type transcriptional regulator/antitoxin MqsA
MLCPACGGAELVHAARDIAYPYHGETTTIRPITGEHCDVCGEAITGRAEAT